MFYSTGRACLAAQAACPDSLHHSNSQEPDVDPKYEPQQAHPTRQSQREKGGNETEWQHGGQGETQRLPIAPTLPWRGWENQHLPRWMLFLLAMCCVVGTPFLSISLATYLEVSYGKDYIITYQPITVCKQAVCLKSGTGGEVKTSSQAACCMTRLKAEVRVCSGASPRRKLTS